ncbi:uncharacterized protein SPSK_00926 [Sporothrix schenckii 1099-18]|uniref:Uncharacterized protein n=1 Tax=Sporothrix schenckii 1099-18 TaxID=1397361 RepID=A0A0F2LW95_SPOSC|nr:uncharacterized protein SPSK_00926 [Sporothrix schenckii 1099-18]KJR81728.1 hypothetical protein SPSK_00926 [Sporothrix schenckii 1099-18]
MQLLARTGFLQMQVTVLTRHHSGHRIQRLLYEADVQPPVFLRSARNYRVSAEKNCCPKQTSQIAIEAETGCLFVEILEADRKGRKDAAQADNERQQSDKLVALAVVVCTLTYMDMSTSTLTAVNKAETQAVARSVGVLVFG